jgi:1-acyl-sn-glycerol-3-phosphate acyltransferase
VERYFDDGYRFIPPYRSTFWCQVFGRLLLPRQLRRALGVTRWQFQGLPHLQESFREGAGVLLTPNHCRWADPPLLGRLGVEIGHYCYYVAAYHLFKQHRFWGWYLNRTGAFSINREGADREGIRACVNILTEGRRPLVLFPEGTWFRQNDRLGPLQEGVALIARQAAKASARPIRIHPVGIKYWVLEDPRPVLSQRLGQLERRLGWRPQPQLELIPRIKRLGSALLAVKEVEFRGHAQDGTIDERVRRLVETRVCDLERYYLGKPHEGLALERIRRLRRHLVRRLGEKNACDQGPVRAALEDLIFCENLSAQSLDYLEERPSLERLTETIQRIEETITDTLEDPVVPAGAVLEVGPAFDGRDLVRDKSASRAEVGDDFLDQLGKAIQSLLDKLIMQGPPAPWHCPPAVEPLMELSSVRSVS